MSGAERVAPSPSPAVPPLPRARSAGGAIRALLRRVPAAAWACGLVALANGLAWSLIVPPFEVPDENAHYAYVQQLAERGTLPHHVVPEGPLSPAEDAMLGAVGFYEIVGQYHNPAPFSELQQRSIEKVAAAKLATEGDGDVLSATNNPPLYYALELIPYKLGSSGGVLDRLALMRLLSVLLGAGTVMLIFAFLRELLPRSPYAWSAGALLAAFQPMFSFISGGVNNDNLLFLCAAGMLFAVARIFRRGLTVANAATLGAFAGIGVIAKLTMLGLLPAAGLALAVAVYRRRAQLAPAVRAAAIGAAVGLAPVVLYFALDRLVWKHGVVPVGIGTAGLGTTAVKSSFGEELSHIWQLFLVPIGMRHQFTYLPIWQTWFKGFFGRFGWLDYTFPGWFYYAAFSVVVIVAAGALVELLRRRVTLRRRGVELLVYALAVVGLCVEIGVQSYREKIATGGIFEQARYLLPVLGLYAAIGALAVRAGGRRWGPVLAVGLVLLAASADVYAQVLTISRYYT